ncbi:MAG: acyl carrier protein [Pseudomonadota bacterium]
MAGTATDDDVARKVIEIIAAQAVIEPGEVRMQATPEDLGLDSLGLVEAVFAIEEAFDITVPFNANDPEQSDFDISTVERTIAAVKGLIAEQKG